MDKYLFILISMVDAIGVAACVWLQMQCRTIDKSWLLRWGVGFYGLGLLFQLSRNLIFLVTGVSPADSYVPAWALKDLGGTMVAVWFVRMLVWSPDHLAKLMRAVMSNFLPPVPQPAYDPRDVAFSAPAKRAAKKPAAKKTTTAKKTGVKA